MWWLILSVVFFIVVFGWFYVYPTPNSTLSPEELADVEARARHVLALADQLREAPAGEYYAFSQLSEWLDSHQPRRQLTVSFVEKKQITTKLRDDYCEAERLFVDPESWRREYNRDFVRQRIQSMKPWIARTFPHSLTPGQRQALVVDEDNNMIVAGAGTGKTTTALAKVEYLLEHQLCEQDDVLVVAFNRSVADEVAAKLKSKGFDKVDVSTFHALGYRIMGAAGGRKPAVSSLATSQYERMQLYQEFLEANLEKPDFFALIRRWFVDLHVHECLFEECKTAAERLNRERGLGRIALDGTRLRSISEVKVANWLSLNGIEWEYEVTYPNTPSSGSRRDYTPDFYLPNHDTWIEVWGVDRAHKTTPDIDAERYVRDMNWKRALHQRHGTTLLEIYQDSIWSSDLASILNEMCRKAGIYVDPLTVDAALALLEEGKATVSQLMVVVDTFIHLYRGGTRDWREVQGRVSTNRDEGFLRLVKHFIDDYEKALEIEGKIDFSDMLAQSHIHISEGSYHRPYRYLLVDEFQDTSSVRMKILQGLRAQQPHARLFVVGDDWQGIYRFTGSDLGLFTNFPSIVGATERVDLDRTFRLSSDVLAVSSRFIAENPAQLKKELSPNVQSGDESDVCIMFHEWDWDAEASALDVVLQQIRARSEQGNDVLLLARYNHQLEPYGTQWLAEQAEQGLEIRPMTVHRSKGLEASHVVVLGLKSGIYGFPSEMVDDPVLAMVMQAKGLYPNEEERRLFYVALTRTKGRVYLMALTNRPSCFVQELLEPDYEAHIEILGDLSERYRCPECQGKTIRKKTGQYGDFWSCLNYPRCSGKLTACFACTDGVLEPQFDSGELRAFRCVACGEEPELCVECGDGFLRLKTGKYGDFWSCSRWRKDDSGCSYTRDRW